MVKGPALNGLFHKQALSLSLDKTGVLSLDYLGIMVLVTEPESLSTPRVPALSSCPTDTPRMGLPWR